MTFPDPEENCIVQASSQQGANSGPGQEGTFGEGGDREKRKKPSLFARVYSPRYTQGKPKYCCGRLTKIQLILVHIFLCFLVVFLSILVVVYGIVPAVIRHKIKTQSMTALQLSQLHVFGFEQNAFSVNVEAALPNDLPIKIPLSASMSSLKLHIESQGKTLCQVDLPPFTVSLRDTDIPMNWSHANISFASSELQHIQALVRDFSSDSGLAPLDIHTHATVDVSVWGFTVYKDFYIERDIPLPQVRSKVDELMEMMPHFMKPDSLNALIKQKFAEKDLFKIMQALPAIKFNKINMSVTDEGPSMDSSFTFENPTKLSLQADSIQFGLSLENQLLCKVTIDKIKLDRGLQDLDFVLSISFDDASISSDAISAAMARAYEKLRQIGSGEVKFAITGPLRISEAGFMTEISQDLALYLPTKPLMDAVQSDTLRKLMSDEGIQSIFSKSFFETKVFSDHAAVTVSASLPRLLPLPMIVFPAYSRMSIGKDTRLGADLACDRVIVYVDDDALYFNTTVRMYPVNSQTGADVFADIVNPLLASTPLASSALVKNITFTRDGIDHYKWSKDLMEDIVMEVFIPPMLSVPQVLNILTRNQTVLPMSIRALDVAQLQDAPGFMTSGGVQVAYPPFVPRVQVNVGYFSLDVGVDETLVVQGEMPQGLIFTPDLDVVSLAIAAKLPQNVDLSPVSQRLIDAFTLASTTQSPTLFLSGLKFGKNSQDFFITFSKIKIELGLDSVSEIASRTVSSVLKSLRMVTVESLFADLKTSTDLDVLLGASLRNPFALTVSLNEMQVGLDLKSKQLVKVLVDPIQVLKDNQRINQKASLVISTGADGLSGEVAQLVDTFLGPSQQLPNLSINNFQILASHPEAVIDHFKSLVIPIPADILHLLQRLSQGNQLIDVSAVLPNDPLSKLSLPTVENVALETLPNASLISTVSAAYVNPFNVGFRLPFVSGTVGSGAGRIASAQVTGLDIVGAGSGRIDLNAKAQFSNYENIVNSVGEIAEEFSKGHVSSPVYIGSVLFGTSDSDTNDLFSLVNVNVNPFIPTKEGLMSHAKALTPISTPVSLASLKERFNPRMKSLSFKTLPQKTFGTDVSTYLRAPFPITIKIGFVSLGTGMDDTPFASVSNHGLSFVSSQQDSSLLETSCHVKLVDGHSLPPLFKRIADSVLDSGTVPDIALLFDAFVLGDSPSDSIRTFSAINVRTRTSSLISSHEKLVDVDALTGLLVDSLVGMERIPLDYVKLHVMGRHDVSAAFSASLPRLFDFPVSVDIGYFGLDEISLDKTHFLALKGENVMIGNSSTVALESLSMNVDDSEDIQLIVMRKISSLLKSPYKLTDGSIGFQGFTIGHSVEDHVKAFSLVSVNVPLTSFDSILSTAVSYGMSRIEAIKDQMLTHPFDTPLSIELSPGFGVTISHLGINTTEQATISSAITFDLKAPFRLDVSIPRIEVDASLGNTPLVSVVSGIRVTQEHKGLTLYTDLHMHDGESLKKEVARIVDDVIGGKGLHDVPVSFERVLFGRDNTDMNQLLSRVSVGVDVASMQQYTPSMDTLQTLLFERMNINIANVDVAVREQQRIAVGIDLGFMLPFPVSFRIGHASATVLVEDNTIARFMTQTISVVPGSNQLSLKCFLHVTDKNEEAKDRMARLVDDFLSPNGIESIRDKVAVKDLLFGASQEDTIKTLDMVRVSASINALYAYKTHVLSFLRISQDSLEPSNLYKSLDPEILSVDAGMDQDRALFANALIKFNLEFPFTVSIPYVALNAGVNGLDIVSVSVGAIGMKQGMNAFNVTSNVRFIEDDTVKTHLASVYDQVDGQGLSSLVACVASLKFGASQNDLIDLFEKVRVSTGLESVMDLVTSTVTSPSDLLRSLNVSISNVDVSFAEDKSLAVLAAVSFTLPFPITFSLGFVSMECGLESTSLLTIDVADISVSHGANQLSLSTRVKIAQDEPDIKTLYKDMVDSLVSVGISDDLSLFVAHLQFGHSQDSLVSVLEKIKVVSLVKPLVLASFDVLGMDLNQWNDPAKVLEQLEISAKHVDVALTEEKELRAAVNATVSLAFPVSITVPFIGFSVGVNGRAIAYVSTRNFQLQKGVNDLGMEVSIVPFTDTEAREFLGEVIRYAQERGIYSLSLFTTGMRIGPSRESTIDVFELVSVSAGVSEILPFALRTIGVSESEGNKWISAGPADLIDLVGLSVAGVGISIADTKQVNVKTSLAFSLDFPLSLSVGFVSMDIGVSEFSVGSAVLRDIHVSNGLNQMEMVISLSLEETETTRTGMALLASQFIDRGLSGLTAHVNGLRFGASDQSMIDLLASAKFSVDVEESMPLVMKVAGVSLYSSPLTTSNSSIEELLHQMDLKIKELSMAVSDQNEMLLSTAVSFTLPFPVSVSLGFVSVDFGVNDHQIGTVTLSDLRIQNGMNDMSSSAVVVMRQDSETKSHLATVLDTLHSQGLAGLSMLVSRMQFGASQSTAITTFDLVRVSVPVDSIAQPLVDDPSRLLEKMGMAIQNISVETASLKTVNLGFSASFELPFPLSVQLPWLCVTGGTASIGSIVTVVLRDFSVKPGTNTLTLSAETRFSSDEKVKDNLASRVTNWIAGGLMDEELVVSGLQFGHDESNPISTFSEMKAQANALTAIELTASIAGINLNMSGYFTSPSDLIRQTNIKLHSLHLKTVTQRDLSVDAAMSLNLPFPVSAKIGYFATSIGVMGHSLFKLIVSDISTVPGQNTFTLSTRVQFDVDPQTAALLSTKVEEFMESGTLRDLDVQVTNVLFGKDQSDLIDTFDKIILGVDPTTALSDNGSLVLELLGFPAQTDIVSFVKDNLNISTASLDATGPLALIATIDASISNFPLDISGEVGYFGMSTLVNEASIAKIGALNNRVSHENGLRLQTQVIMELSTNENAKTTVNEVVQNVLNDKLDGLRVGVENVKIGRDGKDCTVLISGPVSVNVHAYVVQIKAFVLGLLEDLKNGKGEPPFQIETFRAGLEANEVGRFDVVASIKDVPPQVTVAVPKASAMVSVYGSELLGVSVKDLLVKDGKMSCVVLMQGFHNQRAYQDLMTWATNMVFRRPYTVMPVLVVDSMTFGPSEQPYSLLEKVSVSMDSRLITPTIQQKLLRSKNDSILYLEDIQSFANVNSFDCRIKIRPLPSWLPVTLTDKQGGIVASVLYNMNNPKSLDYTHTPLDAVFTNFDIVPGKKFDFDLIIKPRKGDDMMVPLTHIGPRLVSFQDFGEYSLLGLMQFVEGDPHAPQYDKAFTMLGKVTFECPELYMWRPFYINTLRRMPISRQGFVSEIDIFFPNGGPLHIDLGYIDLKIVNPDHKAALMTISTEKPVTIRNRNQNGQDYRTNPDNLRLKIVTPYTWNPIRWFQNTRRILGDVVVRKDFDHMVEGQIINSRGQKVEWLDEIIKALPGILARNADVVLPQILKNAHFNFYGVEMKWQKGYNGLERLMQWLGFKNVHVDYVNEDAEPGEIESLMDAKDNATVAQSQVNDEIGKVPIENDETRDLVPGETPLAEPIDLAEPVAGVDEN